MGVATRSAGGLRPAPDADLEEALTRARAGDEHGFSELFRALQPRLLKYLRGRCGDGAQDVASETWARVVADLHRFRGDSSDFLAWLFTIARYRAIDAIRAAARQPTLLPESYDDDSGVDVERDVADALALRDALRLLKNLPADQADSVALRFLAGLDVATVAQLLGKTENAVRICTHRGLRRLETILLTEAGAA